ncbi:MAG: class I SAM-dependent methyltransferase [Actinomycetota bacterium]|nr:class I SAM-dependent methyltransferase [Actinomycetota bacterium]
MSQEDVRTNLASWEADSEAYQQRNRAQLNRWGLLGWGVWDVPEAQIGVLGEVSGLDALELGCGACQLGIKVATRGAKVTGLDFSAKQLAAAAPNFAETGVRFPLVRASAEELPFVDQSFDLIFCDHGATSFTDPAVTIPGCARVLRPGGLLVFNINTPFISVCWGNDDEPPGRELRRPYFDAYRQVLEEESGPFVEFRPTYGEWVRLFRASGLTIEDLIELRPPADSDTTYTDFAPLEWARDYPGEHIWKLRKERP